MENTGRIRKPPAPAVRRILFGHGLDEDAEDQLRHITRIDQAHLLMLCECEILRPERAARLLDAIERLRGENFAPLRQRPATRGLFLLYEDYLIETEGAETGGILQTARSRNDLNATVLKMRLRAPWLRLLREALRLQAMLLRRARRYSGVVMPIYTHGQAAMPVTYGHYLAGTATALSRDIDGLLSAARGIRESPLGAGAVAGTSFPIRTARTARLLGFEAGPLNSVDAVASRDLPARLLAAAAIYAVSLSRLATDLFQWTTAEFDFLRLPDELVGSSSSMPQKRNPFLLEHVQGRAAAIPGALAQTLGAMHSSPFTNSIATGTEAMRPVWRALDDVTGISLLMRLVVGGAQPNSEAMLRRARSGFTNATAFADRLVAEGAIDFRTAHRMIGASVLETLEKSGEKFEAVAGSHVAARGVAVSFHDLDPASVARSLEFGGGPGSASLCACLEHLRHQWALQFRQKIFQETSWREAEDELSRTTREFLAGDRAATKKDG